MFQVKKVIKNGELKCGREILSFPLHCEIYSRNSFQKTWPFACDLKSEHQHASYQQPWLLYHLWAPHSPRADLCKMGTDCSGFQLWGSTQEYKYLQVCYTHHTTHLEQSLSHRLRQSPHFGAGSATSCCPHGTNTHPTSHLVLILPKLLPMWH